MQRNIAQRYCRNPKDFRAGAFVYFGWLVYSLPHRESEGTMKNTIMLLLFLFSRTFREMGLSWHWWHRADHSARRTFRVRYNRVGNDTSEKRFFKNNPAPDDRLDHGMEFCVRVVR